MEIQISVLSKVGARSRNEDACGYWRTAELPAVWCCVLCDGAGGHGGGDVAARTAVDSTLGSFAGAPENSPERIGELLNCANIAVVREQSLQPAINTMRATMVVATFDTRNGQVCWGHVGDSRLYFFRKGRIMGK